MKHLLVLFALCMLSAAMVPRERKSEAKSGRICASQTPCGWQVYNPSTKVVERTLWNTYCICQPDQHCGRSEDVLEPNTYVFKCLDGEEE